MKYIPDLRRVLKLEWLAQIFGSKMVIWLVIVLLGLLYLDLASTISSYNKRLDDFNTDSYRESIRRVVQDDIDESLKKYQAELDRILIEHDLGIKSRGSSMSDIETELNRIKTFVKRLGGIVCEHDEKLNSISFCGLDLSRF